MNQSREDMTMDPKTMTPAELGDIIDRRTVSEALRRLIIARSAAVRLRAIGISRNDPKLIVEAESILSEIDGAPYQG